MRGRFVLPVPIPPVAYVILALATALIALFTANDSLSLFTSIVALINVYGPACQSEISYYGD